DPGVGGNAPLIGACEYGHSEVVRLLIVARNVDPTEDNFYPLRVACERNCVDVVRVVLTDMRVREKSAELLNHMVFKGYDEILRLLLETNKGRNVSVHADKGIITAVKKDNANLNSLVYAAEKGNAEIRAEEGCFKHHVEVVRCLVKAPGVNPKVEIEHMMTTAAGRGFTEVAELLLVELGANPTIRGNQLVRMAAKNNCLETMKIFLKYNGVDPTTDDNDGIRTAIKKG
ncbi:hypothetical protein HDU76_010447, partial [Blyttiomyces sp. JEL0837]